MIRVAWYAALVLATIMILSLFWQFGAAVVLFLLSLAVEAAFHPLILKIQQRGHRLGLAIAVSYGTALMVVGLVFFLASGPLIANLRQVTDDSLISYGQIKNLWLHQPNPLLNSLAAQMPPSEALYASIMGEKSGLALQTLFGAAQGTFGFLSQVLLVIALSVYWSLDYVQFERLWLSLLPVEARSHARSVWHSIQAGVGAYVRREATLSLLAGILLWLGYTTLSIHYAVLLAVIGALARLIPWLGSLLVVFLPILIGSAFGWWAGPAAATYTLIVLAALELTIGNTIFPRRKYSSLLLVLLMIALADSNGLPGAIFAPILAVALHNLVDNLLAQHASNAVEILAKPVDALQTKMEKIRDRAGELDALNSIETANLVARLEGLLKKTMSVVRKE
jgi:putative permease